MFLNILKRSEILELENKCFQAGYPIAAVMEKAGLKLSRLFISLYPKEKYKVIGIIVGPGHNGGDALVVARELFFSGYEPVVFDFFPDSKKELTQLHFCYFKEIGGSVVIQKSEFLRCDAFVDGIYGFGLNRKLTAADNELIRSLNEHTANTGKPVFSIDLPSGMDADLGVPYSECVCASSTACVGAFKQGVFEDKAVAHVGKLHFVDLNYPSSFYVNKKDYLSVPLNKSTLKTYFAKELHSCLKEDRGMNKYTNSIALALVGSDAFPGAGVLTLDALAAAGIGYLYALHTSSVLENFWPNKPSAVLVEKSDLKKILLKHKDKINFSIVCGSGLKENNPLVQELLDFASQNKTSCTFVWDAGAFSTLKDKKKKKLSPAHVLTPHLGEFKILFPEISKKLEQNSISRIEACYLAAQESGANVVLKGPHTVIASPQGKIFVNLHSTPALAKAGSGDILSGMIAAFCSHMKDPFAASCFSVYTHSLIALRLEKKFGYFAVNPELIVKELSSLLGKIIKKLNHGS